MGYVYYIPYIFLTSKKKKKPLDLSCVLMDLLPTYKGKIYTYWLVYVLLGKHIQESNHPRFELLLPQTFYVKRQKDKNGKYPCHLLSLR